MKYFLLIVVFCSILLIQAQPQQQQQQNDNEYLSYIKSTFVTNITVLMGETVLLNCSLKKQENSNEDFLENALQLASLTTLSPTWLKADGKYDQSGDITGFKSENIIVTRKGVIVDSLKDKIKLVGMSGSDNKIHAQSLKIINVVAKDEGKYICREFNSENDKIFYLKVFASVSGLSMKFNSPSKYFRFTSNNYLNRNIVSETFGSSLSSSISIRENDELYINCTVNSSKPAADLSIWITPGLNSLHEDDMRKLDIVEFYATRNKDYTMKSVAVAKYRVSRSDNLKSIICIAENQPLDEKWETKRSLNILYPPQCKGNQKLVYNTGINQTVELECHMTDSNPPNLEFSWNFFNNRNNNNIRDKAKSSGYISKTTWTPKSEADFGEIICTASNSLDKGECRIKLELGGPPNPPENCYYKENNTTVIIECSPGFHQGDPEMYYYLLKKKSNGVLVEYARKRDSCSFLISKSILEEYLNEFYIYSSNKYGNNKETAVKLIIQNEDILLKNSNKSGQTMSADTKLITIIIVSVCSSVVFLGICCCLCIKCNKSNSKQTKTQINYEDYRQKPGIDLYEDHMNSFTPTENQLLESEKLYSSIRREKAGTPNKNLTSTFMMKDIQDLDMSPRTKRKISENSTYQEKEKYKNNLINEDQQDPFYYNRVTHSKENGDLHDDSTPDTDNSSYYIYNTIDAKFKKKESVWYTDNDEYNYDSYASKTVKTRKTDYQNDEKLMKIDSLTNTNSIDLASKNSKYGILV